MYQFEPPRYVDQAAVVLFLAIGSAAVVGMVVAGSPVLLVLGAIVCAVVTPWYISVRNGWIDFFEPILFHSVFVAMAAITLFERVYRRPGEWQYDVISVGYTEGLVLYGLALLGSFGSTLVGYYVTRALLTRKSPSVRRDAAVNGPVARSGLDRISTVVGGGDRCPIRAVKRIGFVYMALGLVGFSLLIYTVLPGSDPLYIYTTTTPRSEILRGNHLLVTWAKLLYVGYLLWIASTVASGRFPSFKQLIVLPAILGLFFLLGGRGLVVSIGLIATVFLYYAWTFELIRRDGFLPRLIDRTPPGVLLVAGFAVGIVLSVVLVTIRGLRMDRSIPESIGEVDLLSLLTIGSHGGEIDNFLALVEIVPSDLGYYYGTFYLRVVTNFVPRMIWEDKPVLTVGGLVRRVVLPQGTGGRPPGAIGSYFVNFGYPGIVLMGFVLGCLFALAYYVLRQHSDSVFVLLVYSIFLLSIGVGGLKNNSIATFSVELLLLLPVGITLVLIRTRTGDPGKTQARGGERSYE